MRFYDEERGVRLVVHGDDFTLLGNDQALDWCTTIMQEEYDVKLRGRVGPEKHDDKSMRILNRCLGWRSDGLYNEPDPRHAEIIIEQKGVEKSAAVVASGSRAARSCDIQRPFVAVQIQAAKDIVQTGISFQFQLEWIIKKKNLVKRKRRIGELNARQEYVVIEATSAQQVKKRKIVKNHLPV